MKLLDKIKLIIEARSFYVKKARILEMDIVCLPRYRWGCTSRTVKIDYQNIEDMFRACGLKIKRLVTYYRDEKTFSYIVWYI